MPDYETPKSHGAYSLSRRAGDFIFVTGQTGRDEGLKIVGHTMAIQTEQAISNVERILKGDGATLADVVKATIHLSDLALWQEFNDAYAARFEDPRPARVTVECGLAPGILVEIDVIAYTGD